MPFFLFNPSPCANDQALNLCRSAQPGSKDKTNLLNQKLAQPKTWGRLCQYKWLTFLLTTWGGPEPELSFTRTVFGEVLLGLAEAAPGGLLFSKLVPPPCSSEITALFWRFRFICLFTCAKKPTQSVKTYCKQQINHDNFWGRRLMN